MGRRRHTPEQIITALREAEVGLANGKTVELSRFHGRVNTEVFTTSFARGRGKLPP